MVSFRHLVILQCQQLVAFCYQVNKEVSTKGYQPVKIVNIVKVITKESIFVEIVVIKANNHMICYQYYYLAQTSIVAESEN